MAWSSSASTATAPCKPTRAWATSSGSLDKDRNGQADEYTVFAALDSPRGAVFDGDTLYVSHPPFVTALRDTDGDGIADDRRTLVRGLGFGLDFRGADHTTNGLEMGIDGWLYVAVGDYGFVKATGSDGQEIQLRGGGNVRVRPDGSELEIYSRGTRNDYDLAIDPYLNLFARGNTNDGGGFDIRLYHFVAGRDVRLSDAVPQLQRRGRAAARRLRHRIRHRNVVRPRCGAAGAVRRHVVFGRLGKERRVSARAAPKGATFSVTQEDFVAVPRPNDLAIDGSSALYLASWEGGEFRYGGEKVGWVARLTHQQAKPAPPVDLAAATDARLVELIGSANLVMSRAAQAAMLRRGRSAERISLLERRAASGTLYGRVAAIFTLKQIAGTDSTRALVTLADDPAVRAFALRALADRRGELSDVAKPLFVRALSDADPRVALEAVNGLRRMGATDAAAAMLPLTASKDPVIANVTINALAALSAIDASLAAVKAHPTRSPPGPCACFSRFISQRPSRVSSPRCLTRRRRAGARSSRRWRVCTTAKASGAARSASGGARVPTRPGPTTIRSPGKRAPASAACCWTRCSNPPPAPDRASDLTRLATDLQRNRVVPPGGAELLTALGTDRHALLADMARALIGKVRLDVDATTGQLLDRAARADNRYRAAVVKMVVAAGTAHASRRSHPASSGGRPIIRRRAARRRDHRAAIRHGSRGAESIR